MMAFTPRKEFLRDQPLTLNSFALLALSSSNCIRLYSFPHSVIAALRRFLTNSNVFLTAREDVSQSLYELGLDRKPWASPKAVSTEKLLLDIITVIYQSGYTYVSTIDYGREADDRVALVFSTPATPTPNVPPLPAPSLSHQQQGSNSSLADHPTAKQGPFALSFASTTLMRVIAPPLHLTPAILQAVRASWPRGVVSEKKVGENSFEFKLKGYGLFQQDTFATDSLRHILSLLTSLDSQSFTLLTSISLTGRSRIKDLWIFTGPSSDYSSRTGTSEHALIEGEYAVLYPEDRRSSQPQHRHRRLVTEPAPLSQQTSLTQHLRASSTDGPQRAQQLSQPHLLRKPAPRAQVPVSVIHDLDIVDDRPVVRAHLPSTISTGVENMTGVGAAGRTPSEPFPSNSHAAVQPVLPKPWAGSPPGLGRPPLRPAPGRAETPPLLVSTSPPSSPSVYPPPSPGDSRKDHHLLPEVQEARPTSPPLFGLGTFRDSAFSSNSEISRNIPIKWTGPLKDDLGPLQNQLMPDSGTRPNAKTIRSSHDPMFPGGWQPTPIEEKVEESPHSPISTTGMQGNSSTHTHENGSRIGASEIVKADMALRKSEAALVGIIQSTSRTALLPRQKEKAQRKESSGTSGGGQGWVLVNVEGSSPATGDPPSSPSNAGSSSSKRQSPPASSRRTPHPEQVPPAAKAIAVIDALESKHKKSRSTSLSKDKEGSATGVRRFFSVSNKNSKRGLEEEADGNGKDQEPHSVPHSNLRDRLRLIGTPEASRKEGKRRSID